MKKGIRSALAAALCVCLSVSALTGCSNKKSDELDTKSAMLTLDKETISIGAASTYLRYQQAEFENGFGAFIKSYYGDIWNSDLTGSGEAYGNQFKEQILTDLEHMILTKIHAADFGVELSDDDKAKISEAADAFIAANSAEVLEKIGATKESVEEMLTDYTIMTRTETEMGADIDTEVSDEEAAQRTVSYVSFTASTEAVEEEEEAVSEAVEAISEVAQEVEEAISEAALEAESEVRTQSAADSETEADPAEAVTEAATEAVGENAGEDSTEAEFEVETESPEMVEARALATARAEAFLADVLSGTDFFEAAAEVTADEEMDAMTSSYTFGDDDSYPSAEIIEATKGLEDGAIVDHVIQVGTSYYVLHVDDAFDEEATENKKVEIVEQRRADAVQAYYDEWMTDIQFELNTEQWVSLIFDIEMTYPSEDETESVSEAATEGEGVAEIATEAADAAAAEEATEG